MKDFRGYSRNGIVAELTCMVYNLAGLLVVLLGLVVLSIFAMDSAAYEKALKRMETAKKR